MIASDTFNWYEATLPTNERKVRGHFSTPSLLVEQILDACGYTSENDLARLRVLDPACGSGNFLSGTARRLLAWGLRSGFTPRALLTTVQRNLWGFDPDPVACFLAEMQLHNVLSLEHLQDVYSKDISALERGRRTMRFHIHQADGLALPWGECGVVDLFLANPPYLAAKNNDLSGYQSAQRRGQADSYLLFLDLALRVVRPGGWLALVLPDPVLARVNAAKERHRLLTDTTVHHLWHLKNVFPAQVGAVVIIAQKYAPRQSHTVSWIRSKWTPGTALLTTQPSPVSQCLLRSQPRAELRYLLWNKHDTLVGRLHAHMCSATGDEISHFMPLEHFVSIHRGEELGKKTTLLTRTLPADGRGRYPVVRGGVDVRPYEPPSGDYWLAQDAVGKPLERYLAPKILVVKSTAYLQAALDMRGHVALQTLYLLNLHSASEVVTIIEEENQLYFLLALLNSRLLRDYVYVLHTAYKWVQPQIEQHVLARLPIPVVAYEQRTNIIQRARQLTLACKEISSVVELKEQIHALYEEQERAICALYESALSTS